LRREEQGRCESKGLLQIRGVSLSELKKQKNKKKVEKLVYGGVRARGRTQNSMERNESAGTNNGIPLPWAIHEFLT